MATRLPVLLLLLLSSLLLGAAGAHGAGTAPLASTSAFEDGFEEFEDELEEEGDEEAIESECETAREEVEEGELGLGEADEICAEVAAAGKGRERASGKKKAGSSVAPKGCMLRSAHAHAAVNAAGDKLKLTIGYTAYEPAGATLEVRKGSNLLLTKSLRLGRSGVLRIVEDLGNANPPKRVVIRLAASRSPSFCGQYETERVAVR